MVGQKCCENINRRGPDTLAVTEQSREDAEDVALESRVQAGFWVAGVASNFCGDGTMPGGQIVDEKAESIGTYMLTAEKIEIYEGGRWRSLGQQTSGAERVAAGENVQPCMHIEWRGLNR